MTHDPQRPDQGRPDDPGPGRQDPGRQDPGQRRIEPQGGQQGSYQTSQPESGAHQVRAERPRGRSRARLGVLSGLLGLIALGGITAGLVASNAATTPKVPKVVPTHAPTHATVTPTTTPTTSPTTAAKRLVDYTGSASGASTTFVVPSSTVSAHYTYTCPSSLASTRHGFAAQLENASGTDIQPIAASTSMAMSGTVTLHPKDVGSPYHVVSTTNCPFQVKVDSP